MGYVKNFGDVWFNTNSLASILSMALVSATSLEALRFFDVVGPGSSSLAGVVSVRRKH